MASLKSTLEINPWYYMIDNQLIKKRKPCIPGDQVHLTFREGLYSVEKVRLSFFIVKTKKDKRYHCRWDQFRCLKGQGSSVETLLRKGLLNTLHAAEISIIELNHRLQQLKHIRH